MYRLCILTIILLINNLFAGDTLKVLFVYGSRPNGPGEKREFGGMHGGHVSLQYKNAFASFIHTGSLHIFPKKNFHSDYIIEKERNFRNDTSVSRYVIIDIPISPQQAIAMDSILTERLKCNEYDYAFLGFRCASSAYEIMSTAGIFRHRTRIGIKLKYFYPKLLRKKLLREAKRKHWKTTFRAGKTTRKWERD